MTNSIDPTLAAILDDLEKSGQVLAAPEVPDAKSLCIHYGAVMQNRAGYRLSMASTDTATLTYEHAVMSHLATLFAASGEGVGRLAGPAIAALRDICTAEGLRRGVVLDSGNDVTVISLAVELMEEMVAAFTPPWATAR